MLKQACGLVVFVWGGLACSATVGSRAEVPEDAGVTCRAQCQRVGMELSAMAIMANNVGCVCTARGQGDPTTSAGATTAGMATLMLQEQDAQRGQAQAISQ